MIECIFTIDYEIYGNGVGSLKDLVYEPARKLKRIFDQAKKKLVVFVEAAELEMIEAKGTDPAIDLVKDQIKDFFKKGFEIGLHLHPQWYNGLYENGRWLLDHSEYNLCTLPRERIAQIVDRSIGYFREALGMPDYTPLSFRAGNWLLQPTRTAATVLAGRDIRVDSSVFKGAVQHQHKLDYRRALRNGYYWTFADRVEIHDPKGSMLELPIYTQMVPAWKMLTTKRAVLQRKGSSRSSSGKEKLFRFIDFVRLRYPLKLDFCRMTLSELTQMLDKLIREDQESPTTFRPIVAIGHTKDLTDFETVEGFLSYLRNKNIPMSTFEEIYHKCI